MTTSWPEGWLERYLESIEKDFPKTTAGPLEPAEAIKLLMEIAEIFRKRSQKPLDMALCETERVILKVDQNYRFYEHPGCERCSVLATFSQLGR